MNGGCHRCRNVRNVVRGEGRCADKFYSARRILVSTSGLERDEGAHHFESWWSRQSTVVRLHDEGPCGTQVDRKQVASGHRLLITLGAYPGGFTRTPTVT